MACPTGRPTSTSSARRRWSGSGRSQRWPGQWIMGRNGEVPMSDEPFAPQIESIPEQVRQGVALALGLSAPAFDRLDGGTTDRTFRVSNDGRQWALRVEIMPATQLPRAVAAQRLAQSAGVTVP